MYLKGPWEIQGYFLTAINLPFTCMVMNDPMKVDKAIQFQKISHLGLTLFSTLFQR